MKDLLLHPATRQQIEAFLARPSHAVMLVGPAGSGKRSLALELAAALNQDNQPYQEILEHSEGRQLGIDEIRRLEHFLALKVPGGGTYSRFVIIPEAHTMTLEAQNALLKSLEEPPEGTLMILSASYEQALLPTIRSRAQKIPVRRPEKPDMVEYFSQHYDQEAVNQAYSISGGLPGLMHALLGQQDHPLRLATEVARKILSGSQYEKLLTIDELSRQKQLAADVAFILQQMARVSLQSATGPAAKKWRAVQKAAYQASEQLANNANTKLVLDNLMLAL